MIILKARQLGLSWLLAAYALYTAFEPGSEILLLSQTEKDAKKLLAKVKFIFRKLPEPLRPRVGVNNQSTLEFPALESVIQALPSTEMAGRGSTARLVVADEHAFHQWAEENMAAIDPTIEAGGQLISCSSANGIGNLFADQALKAAGNLGWVSPRATPDGGLSFFDQFERAGVPEGGWLPIFLPYNARPGRTEEWWNQKRETFTRVWKIHQEYPREAEEAFVQTGRPVFRKELLDGMQGWFIDPLPHALWPAELAEWRPEELRVFVRPQPGHRYVAGADVAEGLEHGDYSDLCVVDVDGGERPREVLSLHGHWDPDQFAARLDVIARLYPGLYGIERNNHGHAVLLTCKRLGTPGIYRERALLAPRPGERPEPGKAGWLTTRISKPVLVDDLVVAIREQEVWWSDALAYPEFVFYQTHEDGSTGSPAGQWDDRVMSRGILCQMLKRLPALRGVEEREAASHGVVFGGGMEGLRW